MDRGIITKKGAARCGDARLEGQRVDFSSLGEVDHITENGFKIYKDHVAGQVYLPWTIWSLIGTGEKLFPRGLTYGNSDDWDIQHPVPRERL